MFGPALFALDPIEVDKINQGDAYDQSYQYQCEPWRVPTINES